MVSVSLLHLQMIIGHQNCYNVCFYCAYYHEQMFLLTKLKNMVERLMRVHLSRCSTGPTNANTLEYDNIYVA